MQFTMTQTQVEHAAQQDVMHQAPWLWGWVADSWPAQRIHASTKQAAPWAFAVDVLGLRVAMVALGWHQIPSAAVPQPSSAQQQAS